MNENMYAAITGIPAGFKAFVGAMQERLEARYPDCEVRAVQTDKNNGVRLTGIVIMQDGENVTPNIYMEDFYREYLDGRRMEDIECNAALYSRRKKHFIFDSINTITAPSFR